MKSDNLYIGIDLGGTAVKIGLVSEQGELINHQQIVTRREMSYLTVISDIIETSQSIVQQIDFDWGKIKGIGMGIPGLIDLENGVVKFAPNLNWVDVPIKEIFEEKLNIPFKIDNDANLAALGESWTGAGKGHKHIVMATLGTGIGSGIIIDGKILHGKSGMAAELGHIPISNEKIQCGCGSFDCLETVSSATGIKRKGEEVVRSRKISLLTERFADNLDKLSAKDVIDAAKDGDKEALNIINNAGKLLGRGLAVAADLLDPEIIIIGGGLSLAGDIIFNPIRKEFYKTGLDNIVKNINIVPAILGNKAGMTGGAALFT